MTHQGVEILKEIAKEIVEYKKLLKQSDSISNRMSKAIVDIEQSAQELSKMISNVTNKRKGK